MPKYLFTYRMPLGAYHAPPPVSQDEAMAPWVASFAAMGSSVVDPGQPVAERDRARRGRSIHGAGRILARRCRAP